MFPALEKVRDSAELQVLTAPKKKNNKIRPVRRKPKKRPAESATAAKPRDRRAEFTSRLGGRNELSTFGLEGEKTGRGEGDGCGLGTLTLRR